MFQRALVVFENQNVLSQAVDYIRELARRMDCEVTLLMLVEMSFLDRPLLGMKRSEVIGQEEQARKVLGELVARLIGDGVTVAAALRVGDPAQELVKFLAEHPPFQVVVWGSGQELPESARAGRAHWLSKVAGSLECPLITVQTRQRPLGDPPAAAGAAGTAGRRPMASNPGRARAVVRARQQGAEEGV
jgi:hypothetical protein